MKRRILLVDDEVAVLLTMKAVLEISGFDVETAASAREGKLRLRSHEYHMVITDMRMEGDESGREVIRAARTATNHPAVALLTAFPVDEGDWQDLGADQLLLKPMHTRMLIDQIEKLFAARDQKLSALNEDGGASPTVAPTKAPVTKKAAVKKSAAPKKAVKSATKAVAVKKQAPAARKLAKAAKKTVKSVKSSVGKR